MIELTVQKKLKASEGEMHLDVQLEVERNRMVTVYGKSGAGKTSLLMMLAGLMEPDKGWIRVDGDIWFDREMGKNKPPQRRNIGMVFQEYALFPNMTVRENLLYALQKGENKKVVDELIEIVDLGQLQERKPNALSGGQKQRVALARALVRKPKLLLLDEPLSALDHQMRHALQKHILDLHREFRLTTIMISHDVSEILRMSDYVVELDRGRVVRQEQPADMFTSNVVNAKFQFTGEVIRMVRQDFIVIVTVLIGNDLVKVIANDKEAENLRVGDKVLIASKAFNPIIHRIGED